MSGYLDNYGAGDERRAKIIKTVLLVGLVAIVVGGTAYFFLKNYRQERQVRAFFTLLEKQDYKNAYALWGCTDAKPCSAYPFNEFMKDWGPQHNGPISSYRIAKSRSCGSGVIITVDYDGRQEEKLWVQRDDLTIGFSPWPGCPPGR